MLEPTRFPLAQDNELCVCGRIIPDNAVYYGFPLSEDNDEPIAWVNEWHDHCLREWGWERDDSDFGITHVTTYCVEETVEDIRAS